MSLIFIGILGAILPKNPDKYLRDRFWTLKVHNKSKYNFLILGDSRTYRGIAPDEIEKVLSGFVVYNFGFSNGGLNSTIYNAAEKKLIDNDSKKIILLGVSAFSINDLSSSNEQYFQELTRPKEEVFERRYLGRFLNYFSSVTPLIVKNSIRQIKPEVSYISIYNDNGWVESEKTPSDTMEALPYYIKDFTLHTTNYQLVTEMCEKISFWRSKGIKVFAFRPPAATPIVALENLEGNYNEQLIKQKIELAGGHWIEIDPTKYKTYDGSHLPKNEARKLSQELAEKIKAWIEE